MDSCIGGSAQLACAARLPRRARPRSASSGVADDGWHGLGVRAGPSINSGLREAAGRRRGLYLTCRSTPCSRLRALRRDDCGALFTAGSPGRPFGDTRSTQGIAYLTLRALDARQCGEMLRTIAEALRGFHGTKTDWKAIRGKNKARRLVARAAMMRAAIERCCTTRSSCPR